MTMEFAIRLTEILMALAFCQQSLEHLQNFRTEKYLFSARIVLSILLLLGFQTQWVCLALVLLALLILQRFHGPYNGGSDRMSLLILCCLTLLHFTSALQWKEYIFGYLAIQLVLSYFIAGLVKIMNPEWRTGRALQDVFLFSAYPVSESLRGWANQPRILFAGSWAVIIFEMLFPLTFLTQTTLIIGLAVAAVFHFANACIFGLNRFFWIWLAAYPSILWLQDRVF